MPSSRAGAAPRGQPCRRSAADWRTEWAMNDAAMVTIARYSPFDAQRARHHQPAQRNTAPAASRFSKGRRAHVHLEHRHRVGARAHESRLPQADQPGIAGQDVQPGGAGHMDRHQTGQVRPIGIGQEGSSARAAAAAPATRAAWPYRTAPRRPGRSAWRSRCAWIEPLDLAGFEQYIGRAISVANFPERHQQLVRAAQVGAVSPPQADEKTANSAPRPVRPPITTTSTDRPTRPWTRKCRRSRRRSRPATAAMAPAPEPATPRRGHG